MALIEKILRLCRPRDEAQRQRIQTDVHDIGRVVFDNARVRVGDGSTPGGIPQARLDDLVNLASKDEVAQGLASKADAEQVAQALADAAVVAEANAALVSNVDGRVRTMEDRPYVVERGGTPDGEWLWTRWSDGWIEQVLWHDFGSNRRDPSLVVTLPFEMEFGTYNVMLAPRREGSGNACFILGIAEMSSTGFRANAYGSATSDLARHLHIIINGWEKGAPSQQGVNHV